MIGRLSRPMRADEPTVDYRSGTTPVFFPFESDIYGITEASSIFNTPFRPAYGLVFIRRISPGGRLFQYLTDVLPGVGSDRLVYKKEGTESGSGRKSASDGSDSAEGGGISGGDRRDSFTRFEGRGATEDRPAIRHPGESRSEQSVSYACDDLKSRRGGNPR